MSSAVEERIEDINYINDLLCQTEIMGKMKICFSLNVISIQKYAMLQHKQLFSIYVS